MQPRLSIIIPHHRDQDRLLRCLRNLDGQVGKGVELIVVDSGKKTLSDQFLANHPNVRFAFEPRLGAARARNRGVKISSGAILAFLDCDCVPSADWVSKAESLSIKKGIVGGCIELFDENEGPRTGSQIFEHVFAFRQEHYIRNKKFAATANLVVPKDIFEQVGKFRDGVSEDRDWCHRALEKSFSLKFDPNLKVFHPTRQNLETLKKKWVRVTKEEYQTLSASPFRTPFWLAKIGLMPLSIIFHIPRVLFSDVPSSKLERRKALLTLFQIRSFRLMLMVKQLFPEASEHEEEFL